ncbi:hypothetical protein FAZ19_16300 [Sphingobacterium alkalisoli]|uniref:Uncharacterized protein n=1 Tax=Sphingobacterium alkalisoli TaxID=1874115 RepID=A0A4U0GXN5_9SPHI|nr:hypothetical protein [Sphingobacterium alkalisoli]TJY63828.1 hypothetical protein FAZ19_16300 [Sphingobacterium alkalisoli]GGH24619.1 hypothetical protein GCM10011418_32660 [Sphingobacterium alkalisoli]
MKSILKVKKIVTILISSVAEFITIDRRVKGQRAQEEDEFVTLQQLEERSGENVAMLDLDNVFSEENYFEKPVWGEDAEEEGQFVTFRQLNSVSLNYIPDETITMDTLGSDLNNSYPDLPIGGVVFSNVQGIQFTKIPGAKWKFEIIDIR